MDKDDSNSLENKDASIKNAIKDIENNVFSHYIHSYSEDISDDEKVEDLANIFNLTQKEIKRILIDCDVDLRTSEWMRRRRYRNYDKMSNEDLYGIYIVLVINLLRLDKEVLFEEDAFNKDFDNIKTIIDIEEILFKRIEEGDKRGLDDFQKYSKAIHKLKDEVLGLKKPDLE